MRDHPTMSETKYLTAAEAAIYMRVEVGTAAKWRCSGNGPKFTRAGRKILYAVQDLESFLTNRTRRSTSERPPDRQRPAERNATDSDEAPE